MIDDIASHLASLDSVINTDIQNNKIIVSIKLGGKNYNLSIDLSSNFPNELPDVHLLNAAEHGLLPHVCWQNKVCYNDGEGVSIDTEQHAAIIEFALNKAIAALSVEENLKESKFFNEFEGYWNRQNLSQTVYSFIKPNDELHLIKASLGKNKIPIAFLPENYSNDLSSEYKFLGICKNNRTQMNAVYVPLKKCVIPPLPGCTLDINFLSTVIDALSSKNKKEWESLLNRNKLPKDALYLLISQPRPQGGKSLFGISVPYGVNYLNGHIKSYTRSITPLDIRRHTPSYLLERASSNTDIAEKRIVIIGCGSVGSRIAELLIMGGIRHLTLIDNDNFSSDNIFKHILDGSYIGEKKSKSLAHQLKSRFPYIKINSVPEKVTGLSESLLSHDLIIDSAGNPTLSRILNKNLFNSEDNPKPCLLTVWTEPLGLGGHVILSDGVTKGCLHCLFHRDNTEQLSSIFSYIGENQNISRNLTGCGGAFTPFSALDAFKTSEMASRIVLDTLAGNIPKNPYDKYRWWVGDDRAAISKSIVVTPWFYECHTDVTEQINEVLEEGCPVCRTKP